MDVRELGPGDRDHLARRVQLHRARAERDHRAVEGEVLVGEAAQVAQHRGLAVVAVEDRVREERRAPPQTARESSARCRARTRRARAASGRPSRRRARARRCRRASSSRRGRCRASCRPTRESGAGSFPRRRRAGRGRRSSAPLSIVSVSNAVSLRTVRPSRRSPSARIAVYDATRSAIRFSPCGPW